MGQARGGWVRGAQSDPQSGVRAHIPARSKNGSGLSGGTPGINWRQPRMRLILAFLLATAAFAAQPTLEIKVDQAGYLPDAPKLAMVAGKEPAATFTLRRTADSSVALRGKLELPAEDPDTGDRVQTADFSAVKQRGSYYLEVPGIGRSWDFTIAPD